jgi:hypothetical protein
MLGAEAEETDNIVAALTFGPQGILNSPVFDAVLEQRLIYGPACRKSILSPVTAKSHCKPPLDRP